MALHKIAPVDLPVPRRLALRPRDARGYVVPWFVALVDGVYDFRIADEVKRRRAVREKRCWLCGERLGIFQAFVIGPMCAVNRTSSEPPSHLDCATYAVQVCPWLTRPHARRRDAGLPEETESPGGITIRRNPGVALIWLTRSYQLFRTYADGGGSVAGWLLRIGDPVSVKAYAEGRAATADELWQSIVSGYPLLADSARQEGNGAGQALRTHVHAALAELAGLQLLTGGHLRAIDAAMPPVAALEA